VLPEARHHRGGNLRAEHVDECIAKQEGALCVRATVQFIELADAVDERPYALGAGLILFQQRQAIGGDKGFRSTGTMSRTTARPNAIAPNSALATK
jgi:hypothetical protein